MSTARHHAEWLSLVEASGPFLSLPVLLKTFPAGLDAHDPEHLKLLRSAYEEWQDNQFGLKPEPAIHRAWVEFVLKQTLELPEEVLRSGQQIPAGLSVTIAEQNETLRPDWVVVNPLGTPDAGKPRLLVQVLPAKQGLEKILKGSASPATRMMELLHACNVRLGLVTNGEHWMLVNAPKGETTGFISWYSTLWVEEHLTLRAFRSLLGVRRFFGVDDSETLEALLTQSLTDQQEVTDQLGYQVRRAVEVLVQAIARLDQDQNGTLLKDIPESQLYEAALTVMMRLVFLFCAEERGLLLLGDPIYDQHYAVSTLREQLRSHADQHGEEVLERRSDAWCRLLATFRAVYGGIFHDTLQLPAYGGSLFDPDRFPFLEGRVKGTEWQTSGADPLRINNRIVLHLLEALQILQIRVQGAGVEPRRLSFRALDIEQIGHVYEGLLDHTAVRATSTVLGLVGTRYEEPEVKLSELERVQAQGEAALLTWLKEQTRRSPAALKKALSAEIEPRDQQRLRTACNNDPQLFDRVLPFAGLIRQDTLGYPVVILEGSVYVTEGVDRRQTGTHYTPRNLTEEIVQYTLEPLVFEGVAEGKPKEQWRLRSAAELLQLKICDMAMGSGAFLVQTCRYLAGKLVEAWAAEIPPHPPTPSPTRGEGEQEIGKNLGSAPLALHGRGAGGEGADCWEVPESLRQKMLEVARQFRKEPTQSEEVLWQALRGRKLDDRKFRRQQPIGSFVVDFFCASERLIVEVDGGIHETQQNLDRQRQELLESLGLRFVRVSSQLVETNLPQTLAIIRKAFGSAPLALDGRGVGGEGDKGVGSDNRIRILPDGSLAIGAVSEHILPTDLDERLLVARRIVADRCLYGVDKNPLAVEMAKLSLWLVTLAKGRPFTFLDHALKWGDSLLGITRAEQIEYLNLNPDNEAVQYPIASQIWRPILQDAIAKRRKLESFSVNGIEDLQEKERLFQEAERAIDRLRFVGDYLIGRALADAGKTSDLTTEDLMVVSQRIEQELAGKATEEQTRDITALKASAERMLNLGNPANQPPRKPFHWLLEFPEVFLEGKTKGFSAIVGNPPFIGGRRIRESLGDAYRDGLYSIYPGSSGNADLSAFFFLRGYVNLSLEGKIGLLATNTIIEGDTRQTGIDSIIKEGGIIYRAINNKPWLGQAAVSINIIHISKNQIASPFWLDNKAVEHISNTLEARKVLGEPHKLSANQNKSFQGSIVLGMGFVLMSKEAERLIEKEPKNKDVLFPFLNGEDVNSRPDQSPSRWVINFFDWALSAEHDDPKNLKGKPYAADYPDCLSIVEERVKPERTRLNDKGEFVLRKPLPQKWWVYADKRPALYSIISKLTRALVGVLHTKFWSIGVYEPTNVFSHALVVFAMDDLASLALLESFIHELWARKYSGSLETRLRYTPSDCFETFPFPTPDPSDLSTQFPTLNTIGETYYTHRQAVMRDRQEGLTKTYNRFHDPNETADDIQKLRELHIEMDREVANAYGWQDLDLGHDFHTTKQGIRFTISETARREVLDRLLELNHQRYAEEVAQGLHDKKKAKGKGQKAKGKTSKQKTTDSKNQDEQISLF